MRRGDHDGGKNDAINLWNAMPRRPNSKDEPRREH
jgi:hypothetical protein